MPAHAQPWTFTADDYEKMTAAGILKEDHRVELIEGKIRRASTVSSRRWHRARRSRPSPSPTCASRSTRSSAEQSGIELG